jgi:hypothetical protein
MVLTPDEIRRLGLEALRERLGRAGLIQFLQQFDTGFGDHAVERHAWVDRTSLDEIWARAGRCPESPPGQTKRARRARRAR